MHSFAPLAALVAALPSALAAYQGFNYGSTYTDGSAKTQTDFENEFKTAAGLVGTNGAFTSARLYTMVQGGTATDVISAIPAAISTKTSLLLGLWASGGDASFANELTALKSAIATYGDAAASLIAGISVGSEDLYRISPTGIENDSGLGAGPDVLAGYISQVREAIAGTAWSGAPIGHVDTWTAWVNASNDAVINAVDWLGVDAYPYFQTTMANSISQGAALLNSALDSTKGASGGKAVWVTETGWPVSGKTAGDAVPSLANAKTYWDEAGCPLFGNTNIWWYTLQDAAPTTPNPSFGVIGSTLTTTPLYDLSCADVAASSSTSTTKTSTAVATTSKSATTTPGTTTTATTAEGTTAEGTTTKGTTTEGTTEGTTKTAAEGTTQTTAPGTLTTVTTSASATKGAGSGSGSGSGSTTTTEIYSNSTSTGTSSSGPSSKTSTPATITNGASSLSGFAGASLIVALAAMLAL